LVLFLALACVAFALLVLARRSLLGRLLSRFRQPSPVLIPLEVESSAARQAHGRGRSRRTRGRGPTARWSVGVSH